MKTLSLISSNSKLNQICYSNEEKVWHFSFEDNLSIRLECFWRLFSENGIIWISYDHNQMYGKEKPIDLQYELNNLLKNHKTYTKITTFLSMKKENKKSTPPPSTQLRARIKSKNI